MKLSLSILFIMSSSIGWTQFRTESEVRQSRDCRYSSTNGNTSIEASCGSEQIIGRDNRVRPQVVQPNGPSGLTAACGGSISPALSNQATIHPLLCGEGAINQERIQTPVSKKIMSDWDRMSRSGVAGAETRMQQIRKVDLKYQGEIEYPTFESWSYQKLMGDFDYRCGSENWATTCSVPLTETITETYFEDVCVEWEEPPPPPPSNGGDSSGSGSSSGGSYNPDRGNVDTSLPDKPKGKGESSEEIEDSRRKRFEGGSVFKIEFIRSPASRKCIRTEKVRRERVTTRNRGDITYSCMKQRPKYCTWYEAKTEVRRCNNQKLKYTVQYAQDPNWKPGYIDSRAKYRDYNPILPNKFDLLSGETEGFTLFSNFGESSTLNPKIKIDSQWNEYTAQLQPQTLTCEFKKEKQIQVSIHTVGRNRVKAPNPLALPVDDKGNELFPLSIENGRPVRMKLIDKGRATQLKAAALSRTFSKPNDATQAKREVVHKSAKISNSEVNGLIGDAYWHETQFRMQLFEKGRWGRTSFVTVPTHFGSNSGNILGSELDISLTGQDGIKDFYRAAGPFKRLLGWVWEKTGAEFTPGQTYYFRIQALPQGLPFYDNGCDTSASTCDGEQAKEASFSTPLNFEWQAPKDIDNRSPFKKFKDFQKKFQVL